MSLWRFIARRNAIRWFCMICGVAVMGMTTTSPRAATLNVINGILMGATGVTIGVDTYNVDFVDGTCIAKFGGCDDAASDFAFTTLADARTAGYALLAQVIINDPENSSWKFDTQAYTTNGCVGGPSSGCFGLIPYDLWTFASTTYALTAELYNRAEVDNDRVEEDPGYWNRDYDTSLQKDTFYAVFTKTTTVSQVPLPTALPLYGTGLGIMAFLGWRKRRKAAA